MAPARLCGGGAVRSLHTQAANAYKIESRWTDSGKAFEREAACRLKADEKNDAMNAFHNAGKSYKKSDPQGEYRAYGDLE